MSEYMEKHTVARLIGAPRAISATRKAVSSPKRCAEADSVVLLDEIEKAHPDVFNVLLQVLDDGRLTDGQGRTVNFKNTVIIMTTNIGSQLILEMRGADERTYQRMREQVLDALRRQFRPEFSSRGRDRGVPRAQPRRKLPPQGVQHLLAHRW